MFGLRWAQKTRIYIYISKLNTLDNTDTEQFSLSVFVFIDCFVVSALQDAGGCAISRQNNLELHLGCHTCWSSYFTLVYLWCRWTVSRVVYGHVITKFSRMVRLLHFLTHGALLARFARESFASTQTLASQLNRSTPLVSTPLLITPWIKYMEQNVEIANLDLTKSSL